MFNSSISATSEKVQATIHLMRDILLILDNRMAVIFHYYDFNYTQDGFYCDEGMVRSYI